MVVFLLMALALLVAFTLAPIILYTLYRLDGGKQSIKQFYKGVF